MSPRGVLLLVISVPNLVLGALILLRNFRDNVNLFFALYAFSVGLWALGLAGYMFTDNADLTYRWAQEYYAAAAIIALTFFAFCSSFTGHLQKLRWRHGLLSLPLVAVLVMIFFFPTLLLRYVEYHDWGKAIALNGIGYTIYSIYFVSYVLAGFRVIYQAYRKEKGVQKESLKYIFVGLIIAFSLGATFNLILPALGNYRDIWVGPLFTLAYVSFIALAIIKHRLFDVRLVVARSLGYFLSLGILLAGYFLLSTLVTSLAGDNIVAIRFANGFSIVFAVLTYSGVKGFFDRVTNRLFYRDAYDSQAFLDELNKVLVTQVDIEPLLTQVSKIVDTNLKSDYCVFGIRKTSYKKRRIIGNLRHEVSQEDIDFIRGFMPSMHKRVIEVDALGPEYNDLRARLQQHDSAVVVRLVTTTDYDVEGLGYLVLGAKKSGNPYNKQDIKIIEIIANELVIAIQNALRFEEIEEFNVTLQEKIDTATKQLQRSNEKLKAMDETKDEFISMASHQLRTPLTSVKGYLSMVLEGDAGKLGDMQEQLLNQAFVSSQRMVYLIADLLNVSRLKTGKFVIDAGPTNLADMVEGEIGQLTEVAKAKKMKMVYKKPKNFPMLMLDETKVRQVIMNFADNAIYYTPSGGKIQIEVEEKDKTVEFRVTDNGLGVPKNEQPHLFGKFFRAKNARKARPDGTGLGLFMAKKVITASGGSLIFKSEEGKGSTFGFSLAKAKFQVPSNKDQVSSA